MATLEKRLEDPEYKAWVKCGLCLAYAKGGLEDFADERSKRAHNIVITNVVNANTNKNVCPNAVDVQKSRGHWHLNCCTKCDIYVNEIDNLRSPGFSFNKSNWKNSNVQLWPQEAWEMMKVYMNQGQKAFHYTAHDSDLSAVLNFIDHCHIPRVDINNPANIVKIQGADFCITKSSEFALLTKKTEQVQRDTQLLYEEVDGLKTEYEDIKSLLDETGNTFTNNLKLETDQREQHLSQLENQMQEKHEQIKELSSELASLKGLISQDKDLYRKMDIRLRSTENALDKTNTEVREVTYNHKILRKEVDDIKQLLGIGQSVGPHQKNVQTESSNEQVNHLSNLTTHPRADETYRLQNLQRENDNLKQCIDNLKAYHAHNNENKHINDLKAKNIQLTQENDRLHQELTEILSDRGETDTRRELTKSREKTEQLVHEIAILKGKIGHRKHEMTEAELQSFKERNEALERNNIHLLDENERLNTEINTFQQHISHNPKLSLTCILDEKEDLKTEVKNLKMKYETLRQDKSEVDYILEVVTNANERLETRFHELLLEKEEADKLIKDMSAENKDLKKDITTSKMKLNELNSELEKNKVELMTEKNMSKNLEHKIEQINEEKQAFEHEKQLLQLRNKDLEQDISLKNMELSELIKDTLQNQAQDQKVLGYDQQISSSDVSEVSLDHEDHFDTETGITENLEVESPELYEASDEDSDESFVASIIEEGKDPELPDVKMKTYNGMLDMDIVSSRTVDVTLKDDKKKPWITGCVVLSTGKLVLCDSNNSKIKLLSNDLNAQDSVELQGRKPWDISAVNSSTVIVTLPNEYQLQYINLTPRLQQGRVIQMDEYVRGVCVVGDDIYVTSYTFGGENGEVIKIDKNGVMKSRIGAPTEQDNSYMFSRPNFVTVSACTGKIYVSDDDRHTLTCLSADGRVVYQYSDPELKGPSGLYIDNDDNVIVCSISSNNLQLITPSRENNRTLLGEKDGIIGPWSVSYRPNDGTLVVSREKYDELHVFKLSC